MNLKRCCECADGEHENYDNDIKYVVVKDPDTGKVVVRGNMCSEHRSMYDSDGYIIIK